MSYGSNLLNRHNRCKLTGRGMTARDSVFHDAHARSAEQQIHWSTC
ncbi:hypothetical protein RBWH47_04271 [Rhodopirellula baltica WH47]|uniref:Uncharacterized protein n=1 Tax=Rhodopirellula baltica WH47 TaxID=991778 RepID=F2B051_RHOBT|nr:hypothetical protein RBWH47_04271 [Rhodopirellula baltica WH47]